MLVLTGAGLIFFIVVGRGLRFGFVTKTVLIIQGWFCYWWAALTQTLELFCSSPHPPERGLGVGVGWGVGRTDDPQLTKGISHTIWCHVQHVELREGEERGEHLEWWSLSPQVTVTRGGALFSRLNTCLPMGSCEWISCFSLLACNESSCLPTELSSSQLHAFSYFYPSESLPHPPGRGVSSCVGLSWQLGLNHLSY